MRRCLRVIATAVVLTIGALPVAGLVCARQCATDQAATADASEHCHQPESSGSLTISPVVSDACSLIGRREIAVRERAAVSVGSAPVGAVPLHVSPIVPPARIAAAFELLPHVGLAAVCPGVRLPLRI